MNENIYKDKIKFTAECNDKTMVFLDTEVTAQEAVINNKRGLYLIPQMYSKYTDTHQYLNPSSCHSPHITENLPTSVINRTRRNCSDRIDDDKIFKDTMIDCKAYLMKSGYEEELVDEKFSSHVATTRRKDLLRNKKRKQHRNEITKYCMVTDYEPTFPDIRKAFRKFKHIIEDDEELKEIFPKGVSHFQVSERPG